MRTFKCPHCEREEPMHNFYYISFSKLHRFFYINFAFCCPYCRKFITYIGHKQVESVVWNRYVTEHEYDNSVKGYVCLNISFHLELEAKYKEFLFRKGQDSDRKINREFYLLP